MYFIHAGSPEQTLTRQPSHILTICEIITKAVNQKTDEININFKSSSIMLQLFLNNHY